MNSLEFNNLSNIGSRVSVIPNQLPNFAQNLAKWRGELGHREDYETGRSLALNFIRSFDSLELLCNYIADSSLDRRTIGRLLHLALTDEQRVEICRLSEGFDWGSPTGRVDFLGGLLPVHEYVQVLQGIVQPEPLSEHAYSDLISAMFDCTSGLEGFVLADRDTVVNEHTSNKMLLSIGRSMLEKVEKDLILDNSTVIYNNIPNLDPNATLKQTDIDYARSIFEKVVPHFDSPTLKELFNDVSSNLKLSFCLSASEDQWQELLPINEVRATVLNSCYPPGLDAFPCCFQRCKDVIEFEKTKGNFSISSLHDLVKKIHCHNPEIAKPLWKCICKHAAERPFFIFKELGEKHCKPDYWQMVMLVEQMRVIVSGPGQNGVDKVIDGAISDKHLLPVLIVAASSVYDKGSMLRLIQKIVKKFGPDPCAKACRHYSANQDPAIRNLVKALANVLTPSNFADWTLSLHLHLKHSAHDPLKPRQTCQLYRIICTESSDDQWKELLLRLKSELGQGHYQQLIDMGSAMITCKGSTMITYKKSDQALDVIISNLRNRSIDQITMDEALGFYNSRDTAVVTTLAETFFDIDLFAAIYVEARFFNESKAEWFIKCFIKSTLIDPIKLAQRWLNGSSPDLGIAMARYMPPETFQIVGNQFADLLKSIILIENPVSPQELDAMQRNIQSRYRLFFKVLERIDPANFIKLLSYIPPIEIRGIYREIYRIEGLPLHWPTEATAEKLQLVWRHDPALDNRSYADAYELLRFLIFHGNSICEEFSDSFLQIKLGLKWRETLAGKKLENLDPYLVGLAALDEDFLDSRLQELLNLPKESLSCIWPSISWKVPFPRFQELAINYGLDFWDKGSVPFLSEEELPYLIKLAFEQINDPRAFNRVDNFVTAYHQYMVDLNWDENPGMETLWKKLLEKKRQQAGVKVSISQEGSILDDDLPRCLRNSDVTHMGYLKGTQASCRFDVLKKIQGEFGLTNQMLEEHDLSPMTAYYVLFHTVKDSIRYIAVNAQAAYVQNMYDQVKDFLANNGLTNGDEILGYIQKMFDAPDVD